ncbi:hypothetical protein MKX01_030919 [Papaver californicum]|nr:hypothetical protein MKX01_030919 [Papaver californicum]
MAFPPSQLEEADDDFFDKLVDDDEFGVTSTTLTSVVGSSGMDGGSDSDEVRAFANLSMDEVPTVAEGTTSGAGIGVSAEEEKKSEDGVVASSSDDKTEKESLEQVESVSHVGSTSAVFDNNFETSDVSNTAEVSLNPSTSNNSGSKSTCIKEFQWSSFSADGDKKGGSGSGSYSDFLSYDPFADIGINTVVDSNHRSGTIENEVYGSTASLRSKQTNDVRTDTSGSEQTINEQDAYIAQTVQYPGWEYDVTAGTSIPDSTINTQVNYEDTAQATNGDVVSTQCSEASFLQQATQSVGGILDEGCTTGSVGNWNQASQGTMEYPAHMIFDPQHPEWIYDTIASQWYPLASYTQASQWGSYAQAGQSESYMQAGQSESYTHGGQSGSYTQASQPGFYTQASQSGSYTEAGQSESYTHGGQSGSYTQASQPGFYTQASQSGSYTQAGKLESYTQVAQLESYTQAGQLESYGQAGQSESYGLAAQSESYSQADPSTPATEDRIFQNGNAFVSGFTPVRDQGTFNDYGKVEAYKSQGNRSEAHGGDWAGNYVQQNTNMWQPKTMVKSNSLASFTENQHSESLYDSKVSSSNSLDQQISFKPVLTASYEQQQTSRSYGGNERVGAFPSFVPTDNFSHQMNQPMVEQNNQVTASHGFYGNHNTGRYSQQTFPSGTQTSYTPQDGRSPHGRPPHALVTFGFGGKLIVVKDNSALGSAYASKDCIGGSISVLDLMDAVTNKNGASNVDFGGSGYFRTLCHQSFPGPLVGGNSGNKELNTWIDERITVCASLNMDYRNGEPLRLLLSLLKIACQHYGKLRSPFGTDPSLKENDRPESAVAKLFASAKSSSSQLSGYASQRHCLTNVPSEGQLRATAAEVQNLLVSGRTKEALQCAQEGQLWGPALILAAQLGDQHYIESVRQMAHRQLVAGSPLRTLCLLIAGQPADVFSADSTSKSGGSPGALHMSQQHAQGGANGMLDDWEENLAIITANRTKGDDLVILHLGDCLWKERGEITAAHICYLVAEANFESFSDSARLCLIGADHWRCPRTYASPEAIQRTEFYEYTTVLGNSQSVLLPFQPYKLVYAHMLAEVGKVSESLKYCQAITKSLKNGRAPEVETWKQLVSSLEERVRTHQQGGFVINLAPGKLVSKFLPFIDRSIHRMIGPPPPPASSTKSNDQDNRLPIPRVPASQSTMAMSSLIPSASVETISEWAGDSNKKSMPNRSISEPDFGRQANSSKGGASTDGQSKASGAGGSSRFGLFGSTIIQKTIGWVGRSRSDKQAKLGESNRFYYDDKLKRWVEEGTDVTAEETAPPPPPTNAVFQNGTTDYNIHHAFRNDSPPANNGVAESRSPTHSERSSGIPPIPSSSNQFSSRGRMGVRSRYVDTFNKGGGVSANLFQSPPAPVANPIGTSNAKFFVPAPAPTPSSFGEQPIAATGEIMQESTGPSQDISSVMTNESFYSSQQPPPPPSSSSPPMQRFASMSNIPTANRVAGNGNSTAQSRSRRTASWSGSINDANSSSPYTTELRPLGEVLGYSPTSSTPNDPSSIHLTRNGSSFGSDLQEVEL